MSDYSHPLDTVTSQLLAIEETKGSTSGILTKKPLQEALVLAGANISALSEAGVRNSLLKGTVDGQSGAMNAIWGDLYSGYKQSVSNFVTDYFASGNSLPKGNLQEASGKHLLGHLTAIGLLDEVDVNEIEPYILAMTKNGYDWNESRLDKEKRVKLPVWHSKDPTLYVVPALPPGFLTFFANWLKDLANR